MAKRVESGSVFAGPARWKHQIREFERSKNEPFWALFMEQRTGKTPVLIDTVAHQFLGGRIDSLLYIAPNGVHADFVRDYLPVYLPAEMPWRGHIWRSNRADNVGQTYDREALLPFKGLSVLSVNIDAIRTATFRKFAAKFLRKRKNFASVDESLDLAHWSKRTRVAIEIGKRSVSRRILDGTPADAKPLGLFYQFQFLRPGCLGFTNNAAFKAHYAVLQDRCTVQGLRAHQIDPMTGVCPFCFKRAAEFSTVEGYKNLDELRGKIARVSSRVLREECADLPPKVYEKRTFELSKAQRRTYDQLREEFRAELADMEITAMHVLTRKLRLQQITCNFLPAKATLIECPDCRAPYQGCATCGDYGFIAGPEGAVKDVDKINPRLEALDAAVNQLRDTDQIVIWSRFRYDRGTLDAWARTRQFTMVRYDGTTAAKDREAGYNAFRRGEIRIFNGEQQSAGRGLDLSRAACVVYYSNGWSLRFRRQSEDRAQNLAKQVGTLYIDLVAEDSEDENILDALRNGRDLAADVMGDPKGNWI